MLSNQQLTTTLSVSTSASSSDFAQNEGMSLNWPSWQSEPSKVFSCEQVQSLVDLVEADKENYAPANRCSNSHQLNSTSKKSNKLGKTKTKSKKQQQGKKTQEIILGRQAGKDRQPFAQLTLLRI